MDGRKQVKVLFWLRRPNEPHTHAFRRGVHDLCSQHRAVVAACVHVSLRERAGMPGSVLDGGRYLERETSHAFVSGLEALLLLLYNKKVATESPGSYRFTFPLMNQASVYHTVCVSVAAL